jgi:hypothetical protein
MPHVFLSEEIDMTTDTITSSNTIQAIQTPKKFGLLHLYLLFLLCSVTVLT